MVRLGRLTAVLLALAMLVTGAAAEAQFLLPVEKWTAEEYPLRLTLTCEVVSEASSGANRLEQLQALIKHLSMQIDVQQLQEETWSRSAILVAGKPALTLSVRREGELTQVQTSCLPDTTLLAPGNMVNPLSLLTGGATEGLSFYGMDGSGAAWLRDGEALLGKLPALLEPWGKVKKVDTAIKNMGKAKQKVIYTVPAEEAGALAALLSGACGEGDVKQLLASLAFEGKQQFVVYHNADGVILKATYDGKLTLNGTAREASFSWSLRRDDDHTRDSITIKTPAVKGNTRNNLTFSRVVQKHKSGTMTLDLKARMEQVADKQMTSWECTADLKSKHGDASVQLTGDFTLKHTTPDDVTHKLILQPDLAISNGAPALSGRLTATVARGTNTQAEVILGLTLGEGEYFNWDLSNTEFAVADMTEDDRRKLQELVASGAATALVRHIACLPEDASQYLFDGIDESVRAQIVEIARKALQEEEAR